jgi:hypothetical protein
MTHWYREPKRVKLMEHLERAGINGARSTSQNENFKASWTSLGA